MDPTKSAQDAVRGIHRGGDPQGMTRAQRTVVWTRAVAGCILALLLYRNRAAIDHGQMIMLTIALPIAIFATVMHYRQAGRSGTAR